MFGPFSLGDSVRVYRLQHRGIPLDPERSLTRPHTPLGEAWLALLTQQAMGQPAYVLYGVHDGEAFVQIRYRPHQAAADVAYVAPALGQDHSTARSWSALLDGACADLAARGIQRVFANLPESGAEVDVFHQSGFGLYTGEDLYFRPSPLSAATPGSALAVGLRPQRLEDLLALQKLCVAVTPQRVRQAEGGIAIAAETGRNSYHYVLPGTNGDEIVAALSLRVGGQAHWMRLVVHPEVPVATEELIRWALAALAAMPGQAARPVICPVRKYEGGVRSPLEAEGFHLHSSRTLVVKNTVAWVKVPVQEVVPALKGGPEPVPPAYRVNGEAESRVPNGTFAIRRES